MSVRFMNVEQKHCMLVSDKRLQHIYKINKLYGTRFTHCVKVLTKEAKHISEIYGISVKVPDNGQYALLQEMLDL